MFSSFLDINNKLWTINKSNVLWIESTHCDDDDDIICVRMIFRDGRSFAVEFNSEDFFDFADNFGVPREVWE